ncbi:MAG: type I-C CRISPR-associated endonuclease Cas1c [Coriobacteriia bacterium]|nr:type I-C CRISPR-associated endonuclease Cas1c [Coriobacteriia bacterium]
MKRLLNTLFVTTEDAYLTLDGDNVVVMRGEDRIGRFPLHNLEAIYYFGYKGASPRFMGACAERGIDLSFFSPHGKFLAKVCGETRGNVLLRREQYRIADDTERSCDVARNFIIGKVFNSRWVIERARRDHPLRVDMDSLAAASAELASYAVKAREALSLEELRGAEGAAARCYFGVFNQLVLVEEEAFAFSGRSKRPPRDPINALLSFGYSIQASSCASALEGVGLDPYCGFMHQERAGRKSLALDLVEEFRSVFVDRLVLSCINNRMLSANHFETGSDGGVRLTDKGRGVFFAAWQKKKKEELRHPFLNEKLPWGLLPHVQALLLARYIRGDLDGYPPFMWK